MYYRQEIVELRKKIKHLLSPKGAVKINLLGAVVNALLALGTWPLGLHVSFAHIFLASGVCFLVAAGANMYMIRIQSKK